MGSRDTLENMSARGNFVHLHNHTHYSMLDGASKIPDLVARVKELGQPAVGITDHGNMHGAYEMWRTCVDQGVKPIIGIEAYVTPGTARQDKTRVHWGTQEQIAAGDDVSGGGAITHMTLWAENDTGLRNLMKASSVASLEGRFGKWPRMDQEVLEKYHEGVIAASGCPSSIIQTRLRLGQYDEALKWAETLQDIFGKENFYIELMNHGLEIEKRVIPDLLKIAKTIGAPLVATNDSHYVREEDAEAQDSLLCINSGARLDDPDRFKFDGSGYYIKSAEEMRDLFSDFPDACDNTLEIAERCNVMFDDHEDGAYMPKFNCPKGWDETSLFLHNVQKGLEWRFPKGVPAKVSAQADYECGVICQMQFPGYFLVVSDYVNWAKQHGIQVGPGRGSAGGAVVTYALGITEIDPMKHGLIFERFLNPERVSLPDIDIDFDPVGRMKVLQHVSDTYGTPSVAQCTTYGTIKTKQALKDASRIMGYEFAMGERLTKALPSGKNGKDPSLKELFDPKSKHYAEGAPFRQLCEKDPDAKAIVHRAMGIEGLIRQTGVHACATIMADISITDISPLMERTDGTITTVFEYHTCETLGLVKNDFLGLSNLTTIHDTLANIRANKHEDLKIESVPLDDKATYQLLAAGDTLGVFQLDSDGMRSLLRQLKPTSFNDVSALIALYRPGPMDMNSHINYAKRKNGLQKITPINPEVAKPLAPVLDETYGLIVYQEQVQSAARILAGYSLGEADVLRRAMGKKKPEVLAHEKVPFFKGMQEHGYSQKAAQDVWDVLVPFAGYAFNKAHSSCYGLISYWTAYLKAHYPVEFMAALLQGERTNKDKTAIYLAEARRMGIKILPPDVNESVSAYSAVGKIVRFGLGAVRNVGEKVVDGIIDGRKSGSYKDFLDFIRRVPLEVLNKRAIEALIKGGAFDSISPNRHALFMIFESAIDQVVPLRRKEAEGQFDLFADPSTGRSNALGDATIVIPNVPEWDKKTKLNFERQMLGLYVSDHPLSGMSSILSGLRDMSIAELINRAPHMPDRTTVTLCGMVTNVDRRISKNGNPWALVTIEDMESSVECLFFGRVYQEHAQELKIDEIIQIQGQPDVRDESIDMRVMDMTVPTIRTGDARPLEIYVTPAQLSAPSVKRLESALRQFPGVSQVFLMIVRSDGSIIKLTCGDQFRVNRDTSLFAELKTIFGVRCVREKPAHKLSNDMNFAGRAPVRA